MNSRKILFAILLVFAGAFGSFAQSIFTNPIAGTNPNTNNPYVSGQTVDANISVTGIGRGTGITGSNSNNRYNANAWSTSGLDLNDYFEFTLSPNVGYVINFVSFVYTSQVSSGTSNHVFRSSVDSYTSDIGTPTTTGTTISLTASSFQNVNSPITFRIYSYNLAASTTTFSINDFTFNGTVTTAGFTTAANGNWNVGTTWVGGVVPTSSDNAIVNHNVTLNGNVTRDSGTTTTVNAGKILSTGAFTYTNNGTTTVNGTLTVNAGGVVNGTTNLVYGSAGALVMSHSTGVPYSIAAGQRFWPIANPPFNVTLNGNSPTQLDMVVGPVNGTLLTAAALNIVTPNALTVNGTLQLNSNSFINTNSPIYGASSTLIYTTTGTFGRGFEWRALGVGTIGSTPGYPNNVTVKNGTTLDYINTGVANAVGIKAIAGNLSIEAGCNFNMDTGSIAAGGALIAGGNVTVAGSLVLGVGANDDLKIGGNFVNIGVFNANNRAVFFTKTGVQTISSSSVLTFPYVVFQPAVGATTVQLIGVTNLIVSAPAGGNAVTFNSASDIFDINSKTLTIGTSGIANVIAGAGTFRGSTTSVLNLVGTGSIGTLTFGGTAAQQTLGTFTVDRTSGAVACVMGSDLTVATTVNLNAGIVDLNAATFTLNQATTVSGASASNYFIADNAFGGILRKQYTATGSFTFPVGDKTATMEYSPATLDITARTGTSTTSYIGMSVNDSKHPNMNAPADFISRYWAVTKYGTITAPTYTFTGTYLPIDINGAETNSFSQFWNGSAWSPVGTFLAANTLNYGGATTLPSSGSYDFSGGRREQEINIKQGATSIASGGTHNFGSIAVGSNSSVTFTIENLGNANLLLYSNTVVAAPFSLTTPLTYTVTISNAGTATFTIQFAPTTAGPFTGSISFANNDSDENPYIINFTGTGIGSFASDISRIALSEPLTISSTAIGTISTITDGIEAWRFYLRDGGITLNDTDLLATTMTDLVITQAATNNVGLWNNAIEDIVLVNLDTNTIVAHGVVTTNQIKFNAISVVAADNSQVLLGLRLTLKCPLGGSILDGEDIGFQISNPNVTFAPSGSGKTTFAIQVTANSRNVIAVVATKLTFTTQPITTGVSIGMTNVVVTATDACGNKDKDKTGSVALTSSGTMNPIGPIVLSGGSATFTGITHTVVGTDFNLSATIAGFPSELSTLFDISIITVLNPGDLAVLAVNTSRVGGFDEISFVCFRDLLPGTQLFITDNGYERLTAGLWGGSEGVITITRTGSLLPKGTIITIITTTANVTSSGHYDVYTCGAIDTNWTKTAVSGGSVGGFNLNGNDDIYFMQGGVWTNNTGHLSTYTGNVLYGWTESGWDAAPGGDTSAWSTLYPGMECFNTIAPTGPGKVKFNDPIDPDFSTTTNGKFDWIGLINNQSNWNSYADNATYVANGFDYAGSCSLVNLAPSTYVNGRWSGRKDTNWFNCLNWETLIVPTATTNVVIPDTTYDRAAEVDAAAPFAIYSNYIAKTNNLTIVGEKVVVKGNVANKLEVHGNLTIANTAVDGALDMNGGTATDGQLYLYGNWNNNKNNNAFNEGNGTVHFTGTTPQIINAVTPLGTESFKNVVLNTNFDTGVSNDLFATGDVIINAGKTLSIDANGYVNAYNKVTSNGNVVIENNGQLIQVNDTDANDGDYSGTKFSVKRNYTAKDIDYVYWCAPTKLFNVGYLPAGYRYQWNPTKSNPNGTQGNWITPTTSEMVEGKGYIARTFNGSATATTLPFSFYGKPNNGIINVAIARGTYTGNGITTGLDYDAEPANANNVLTTRWDDNWNLVGNPYPSAIKALDFLSANTTIEGFVNIWTHLTLPSSSADPFYYNFGYNYTPADYITYNGTGTVGGPTGFNGKIASGQGFFVLMKEGPAATGSIFFNNAMRSDITNKLNYDNSQFYRTTTLDNLEDEEKNRIWLDIVAQNNQMDRTLVGYVANASDATDRLYDAVTKAAGLKIYSFAEDNPIQPLCIQGKGLPFIQDDTVQIGYSVGAIGTYKVAIGAVDGLFTGNQNIYLEDKLLNIIHDLRVAPYNFTTPKGIFNDRFLLRYTTNALGTADFDSANQVIVSINQSQITITSQLENMAQVQIYDLLGREIYAMDHLDTLVHTIANTAKNQALIIKITLNNGSLITKKIIVK
ncbi:choice-of-anchor D domain-containing protein [Flavobacterium sp.]